MSTLNQFTGERLLPTVLNDLAVEHLARYAFTLPHVTAKNVLDLACGEGYGSALLAKQAASVVGVDVDEATIKQARKKYAQQHLRFLCADADNLPLADESFDVVVSFETLEHVRNPQRMLAAIKRVLKRDGLLVMSTPDREVYSDARNYHNPFHHQEFTKAEFQAMLQAQFGQVKLFGQQALCGSLVQPLQQEGLLATEGYSGSYTKLEKTAFLSAPTYIVALASDAELPMASPVFFHGTSVSEDLAKAYEATWAYRIGRTITAPARLLRKAFTR